MRMRIRGFASVVLAVLVLGLHERSEAQVCVAPPAGLVGWWAANGTTNDAVAGNIGQLGGDAGFATAVVGQGFRLDGFGDFVEIADSPALKPAHVSVEAWVRFDSLNTPVVSQYGALGLQYILFKKNSRLFIFEAYALRKQREAGVDRLVFSVADINGTGGTALAMSTTAITLGEFYHVIGTYDGSYVRLYVNGALEGQSAVSITVDYGIRPVFIGTSGEAVFDGKLHGIVDEASVYNRALGATEVAALYGAGSTGKCASATALLTTLAAFVQTLNLSNGISNSLDVKLENARRALDEASAGDLPSACNRMGAFMNAVSAQAGKALSAGQATQLTSLAGQVRAALGCQ